MFACRRQDFLTGHHHPKIDHFVVITSQDYPDDVLPDVMHVALDRSEQDLSVRA